MGNADGVTDKFEMREASEPGGYRIYRNDAKTRRSQRDAKKEGGMMRNVDAEIRAFSGARLLLPIPDRGWQLVAPGRGALATTTRGNAGETYSTLKGAQSRSHPNALA